MRVGVRATYDHVRTLLYGVPLAVTPGRFDELAGYLRARAEGTADVQADLVPMPPLPQADDIAVTDQGVAVVPIRGTLAKRAGGMASLSGLTSYDQLVALVEGVATRPDVRGLVLAFDSPGGSVAGVLEAADALAAVAKDVPTYAVADGLAASAAYWLAMQARQLWVSPSATVGSIGVFAVRDDASAQSAQQGVTRTIVKSGALKGAGDPKTPVTDAELADLQRQVDQAAGLFFGAVADRRGMTPDAVAGLEGATYMGADAVTRGLADRVGTVDEAVAALAQHLAARTRARAQGGQFMPTTPYADLPVHPDRQRPWDGPGAQQRVKAWATTNGTVDMAKYAKGFFWVDPAKRDQLTGYKLGFADVVDGKLMAIARGVMACGGVMMGARGGVDIPAADMPGVKAHVAKYYAKMQMQPPWAEPGKKGAPMEDGMGAEVIDLASDPRVQEHVAAKQQEAVQAALERDREVRGLCALFGVDAQETEALVASGKPRADIYEALQKARVAAETATATRGAFHAGTRSAPQGAVDIAAINATWDGCMAKARERRARIPLPGLTA